MLLRGVASDSGEAMNQIVGRPTAWSRETMKSVQDRLKRVGYYGGPVDGLGGAKMRAALSEWRRIGSVDLR